MSNTRTNTAPAPTNTSTSTSEASNTRSGDEQVPTTMTAVTARAYGGPEVLAVEELPVPTPQAGELLVEVRASSLNALDWHFLTGTPYLVRLMFGMRRPKRFVRGADVAGVVVAVGADVTRFAVGDSVFGEGPGGGCGEYLAVKEGNVVAMPDGVSFEAAGATPVAGLTALQGLRTHGAVQPGERVLINGAAGGVGTMAVQIAKVLGAHVTAVCSTRNVEMVRALGADEVLDYTRDDFVAGGARFDVMLDNVGSRTPRENRSVLRAGGRYVGVSGPKANRWIDPLPVHRAVMAGVRPGRGVVPPVHRRTERRRPHVPRRTARVGPARTAGRSSGRSRRCCRRPRRDRNRPRPRQDRRRALNAHVCVAVSVDRISRSATQTETGNHQPRLGCGSGEPGHQKCSANGMGRGWIWVRRRCGRGCWRSRGRRRGPLRARRPSRSCRR